MKKIIPFKKEILFKTNLSEITSISLEHSLHKEQTNLITGEFMINGEYKMTDSSVNTESFSFQLPFDINMDDHYILDDVVIDMDDFYYEIIDSNTLVVNIEVLIDQIGEKPLIIKEELIEQMGDIEELLEKEKVEEMAVEHDIQPVSSTESVSMIVDKEEVEAMEVEQRSVEHDIQPVSMIVDKQEAIEVKSLFDHMDAESETYSTYKVYIVREGDSIEAIMQTYSITKEQMEQYNDLSEISIGDKLIIPATIHAQV